IQKSWEKKQTRLFRVVFNEGKISRLHVLSRLYFVYIHPLLFLLRAKRAQGTPTSTSAAVCRKERLPVTPFTSHPLFRSSLESPLGDALCQSTGKRRRQAQRREASDVNNKKYAHIKMGKELSK
ncbi:hypothetical protein RI662_12560, partial [Brevibacillus agri]|uniref:hypothetical protein n=1 Tax=Brevibacillus agri TaxID=51101 RepID=UPI0028702990